MLEINLWNPDENGVIRRNDKIPDTIPGISRFQQIVLHQGRIERFFLDMIDECGGNSVERGIIPTKLLIDESLVDDYDAYPLTVTLRHLSEQDATPNQAATSANGAATQDGLFRSNLTPDDTHELLKQSELDAKAGQEEIVHAKYLLGGDGAHSWVREQLGFKLEGVSISWHLLIVVTLADCNRSFRTRPIISGACSTLFPLLISQTSECDALFIRPAPAVSWLSHARTNLYDCTFN